jgi:type I restriction enzyme S subunit
MNSNNTNTTYKQTPIGLIPSDWEIRKLGELGEIIGGLTYSPDDICEDEGTLVLRSSNIQDGQLVFDDNVFVKVNPAEFNPVQKDDILICVRNGSKSLIGKNALITDKVEGVAFGAFMAVFRSKHNTFLFQIFDTDIYYKEIHQNLGATINSINGSDLKLFKIPIPPLPEQQKIATILSTWDAAIDNCKAIIDKLKKRNKGLAQQLLTGKIRVKGFEKKWTKEMLEIYLVKHDEKSTVNNQYPILTSSRRGIFLQSEYYTRDVASEDNTGYNVVPRGFFTYRHMSDDLIFKFNRNTIVDKGIVSTLYPVFTTKNINELFLLYKLNEGNEFKIHALEQKQGGSRTYIYFKSLCQLKLNMPSTEEQNAIVNILEIATSELNQYQQKLAELQQQKKGLMQQLLTGKTRVKIN